MYYFIVGICLIVVHQYIRGRMGKPTILKGLLVGAFIGLMISLFKKRRY